MVTLTHPLPLCAPARPRLKRLAGDVGISIVLSAWAAVLITLVDGRPADLYRQMVYSMCSGLVGVLVIDGVRLQFWDDPVRRRRLMPPFLALVVLTAPVAHYAGCVLGEFILGNGWAPLHAHPGRMHVQMILFSLLGLCATFLLILNRERIQRIQAEHGEARARAEAIERQAAQAQLRLLQAQIEPHMHARRPARDRGYGQRLRTAARRRPPPWSRPFDHARAAPCAVRRAGRTDPGSGRAAGYGGAPAAAAVSGASMNTPMHAPVPAPMPCRALIAEDEPVLAAVLAATLARLWPELQIGAIAPNGVAAVDQALALRPDVLFLDIKMPGQTGLEAAEALLERWDGARPFPQIVFVTAYDDYAVQAFERAAVGNMVRLIPVQEVVYFQALDKYVNVATVEGDALIRLSLKELLPRLDAVRFCQVSRGCIVNLHHVGGACRDTAGKLTLTLRSRPDRLKVSPLYAHLFRQM